MASSKNLKIVKVKWVDPTSIQGWLCPEDVEKQQAKVFTSVGFLFEDSADRVYIVQTWGKVALDGGFIFPKGCVLTIDEVGEVEIEDN